MTVPRHVSVSSRVPSCKLGTLVQCTQPHIQRQEPINGNRVDYLCLLSEYVTERPPLSYRCFLREAEVCRREDIGESRLLIAIVCMDLPIPALVLQKIRIARLSMTM